MAENLIEVSNLKKYFFTPRGTLHAVDNVTFNIEKGRTIGIVGESGCGKSTLGKTLMRLHTATSGKVMYKGSDIASMPIKEFKQNYRSNIQMIFQDPYASLDPRMSVLQLVEEPIKVQNPSMGKAEVTKNAQDMMELVGLAKRLEGAYPHELDGGRRQRIGIARALSLHPEFIVCDEPVSALDVSIQAQVVNMFEDLQKEMGLTYLFIAHDLSIVKHISDRIGVMYLGKLVELADSYELITKSAHPYTRSLISAIPIADPKTAKASKRIPLQGDVPSPLNPPSGCRFRTRCPYATEQCAEECPEFKEISPGHWAACHNLDKLN